MKLQSKIISLLVPLILLPLLSLGWLVYEHLLSTQKEKSYKEINTAINRINKKIEQKLNNTISNINLLSYNQLLIRYSVTTNEEYRYNLLQRPLHNLVAGFQKEYPGYYEIRIILPDGYEDFRHTLSDIPNFTEQEFSPFIQNAINSKSDISYAVLQNPDIKEPALYISKRLNLKNTAVDSAHDKPALRGLLVVTSSLDFFSEILQTNRIGNLGALFITDQMGNILVYNDSKPVENINRQKQLTETLFLKLAQSIKQDTIIETDLFDKESFVKGVLIGGDLYLFAQLAKETLLAKTHWIKNIILLITSLTIVLTVSLLFIALKHFIIRPINKLNIAANEIGHGNLKYHLNIDSTDEIGSLANTIKGMSENLKKYNQQINYMAYHDELTGLPNRAQFKEYLEHMLAGARRKDENLALLFLDLDNFKWINDTYGHAAGDVLL